MMHDSHGAAADPIGALEGIRVVELGQGGSAPFCAQLLADHGADVLTRELPGDGVGTRGAKLTKIAGRVSAAWSGCDGFA